VLANDREVVVSLFNNAGLEVVTASDGWEALALARGGRLLADPD
jgi:CheY-like chemotaxis protein